MINQVQSPLFTVPETAQYLNLPVSKIYELVRAKDFPAIKLGKSWRIFKEKLDPWLISKLDDKPDNIW